MPDSAGMVRRSSSPVPLALGEPWVYAGFGIGGHRKNHSCVRSDEDRSQQAGSLLSFEGACQRALEMPMSFRSLPYKAFSSTSGLSGGLKPHPFSTEMKGDQWSFWP